MAGASHGLGHSVKEIEQAVIRANRSPVERTTTYGRPNLTYAQRLAAPAVATS
jgi:2-iminoacetate synthase ThiH